MPDLRPPRHAAALPAAAAPPAATAASGAGRRAARLAAALGLGLYCASLLAGPAPWYIWRSKVDGARVCHQTPLGPGWEVVAGPYRDSHCEKPSLAK
ncbi:hypothetical protein [Rugamonas sp. DEMB1]|uniref:hypothetical protein n=1 Tax=Rugamonas sp. DEMB1 TaxID=3039386 RepID=UPI0028BE4538|nr:hypothetical protein [Rugamonas sp. DEMB1]